MHNFMCITKMYVSVRVCVCVKERECVHEREKGRERERDKGEGDNFIKINFMQFIVHKILLVILLLL